MKELKQNLYFLRKLVITNMKAAYSLKVAFYLRMLFMLLNNALMLILWIVIFNRYKIIGGWSMDEFLLMTAVIHIGFAAHVIFSYGLGQNLARYIAQGEIDNYILQPKNIILNIAGSKSQPSGFGDLATGIILLGFSGYATIKMIPLLILFAICSYLFFTATNLIIGSCAFYMNHASKWAQTIQHMILTIGVMPASIYDGLTKILIFTVIPVGFISFLPVEIARNPNFAEIGYMVGGNMILLFFALWFFYNGLNRYESGNRFGVRD